MAQDTKRKYCSYCEQETRHWVESDSCAICDEREGLAAAKAAKEVRRKKKAKRVGKQQSKARAKNKAKSPEQEKKKEEEKEISRQQQAQKELARRELARRNLLAFVMRYEPKYMAGWVHKVICEELMRFSEAVVRGESPRLMITMPPRHGKSLLASQYFPAWHLGNHPDHEFINTSYAQSLQMDFSRKIQELVRSPDYQLLFDGLTIMKNNEAVERWGLSDKNGARTGGGVLAAGVGGPITGRGAHVLLIDDPVKNREEAESQTVREGAKSWYSSTAYTRLAPGGGVLVIQCMTGDTSVMMADGTEKRLDEIRPADTVATYEHGRVATSEVVNWASSGYDRCLTITTSSGRQVQANARHPFAVERNGELQWVRAQDLRLTDKIVCLTDTGREKLVNRTAAIAPSVRKDTAPVTTTKRDGHTAIAHLRSILSHAVLRILSTDTDSRWKSTIAFWLSRAGTALCAASLPLRLTPARTGTASFASTTVTRREKSVGYSATTAILRSDMPKRRELLNRLHDTSDFTSECIVGIEDAGTHEVFDVEIAGTENFIANSFCSGNTRWHDDDLSGWLLSEMREAEKEMRESGEWPVDADHWRVIDFPAIATHDEKYRKKGEALHEDRYPLPALLKIKRTTAPRDWAALYQQNPQVDEGAYFEKEWVKYYNGAPPPYLDVYAAADLAISQKEHADFSVFMVAGIDQQNNIYMLEEQRGRFSANKIIDIMFDIHRRHKPRRFALEKGHISLTMEDLLNRRRQEEKLAEFHVEQMAPGKQDKQLRARSFQGLMSMGKVYWPLGALWVDEHINELLRFPAGVKDDRVDTDAWLGKVLVNTKYQGYDAPRKNRDMKSWKKKLAGYISGSKDSNNPMSA